MRLARLSAVLARDYGIKTWTGELDQLNGWELDALSADLAARYDR